MKSSFLLNLDYAAKSKHLKDDGVVEILKGISKYFHGLYRFEILALQSCEVKSKGFSNVHGLMYFFTRAVVTK